MFIVACGRPSCPATVTQFIAKLYLEKEEKSSETPVSDSIEHIGSPDLSDSGTYYGQVGTALICFGDLPTSSDHSENPCLALRPPDPEASIFILYQEEDIAPHLVSQVATAQ
jgi:hypothetical protein